MNRNSPKVCIRQAPAGDATALLEEVLDAAAFWERIESVCRERDRSPGAATIAIKPDLDVYNAALPSGTDPDLVSHLARLLRDKGFESILVIDARNSRDRWLLNREPLMVADFARYDFSGELFEIVGDGETASAADYWSNADFRINFAKNRTHESQSFALCTHNLLGVSGRGISRSDLSGRCLEVLRACPPDFNIVDAFTSFHGAAGERAPVAIETCTLLAGDSALLVDVVGASKMGLDPYISPISAKCLSILGMPALHGIDGDLSVYPLWQNVHPLVAETARRRNEAHGIGAAAEAWFQTVDRDHFPFREFYSDRFNSFIAPVMQRIGEDARARWLIVFLNIAISGIGSAILAQNTLFSKGKLRQQVRALETDLSKFDEEDYLSLPEFLAPFEQLVNQVPDLPSGEILLKRFDDATLFFGSYEFPIRYDEFVARVDIRRSIQYMNDYIGGSMTTVAERRSAGIELQAERNLYLQQPNWIVLFGGDVIDVEKIELVRYQEDRQEIFWQTVASPNGSAQSDDGRVSFSRTDNDCVRLEIFTRQKFALPTFFQLSRIDLFPGIREPIVEAGYRNFFERTISNMRSCFDGRDYRVGFGAADQTDEGELAFASRYLATAFATLSELLRHKGDMAGVGEWFAARSWTNTVVPAPATAGDGFQHFGPTPSGTRYDRPMKESLGYLKGIEEAITDTPELFAGLASAVQRDLEAFADKNDGKDQP